MPTYRTVVLVRLDSWTHSRLRVAFICLSLLQDDAFCKPASKLAGICRALRIWPLSTVDICMAVRLGAGAQAEAQRTLLRSLELLASQGPESEDALLTMLQKAKKEADSARPSIPSNSTGLSKPASQV